jgi:hypothetical protein
MTTLFYHSIVFYDYLVTHWNVCLDTLVISYDELSFTHPEEILSAYSSGIPFLVTC